MRVSNFLPAIMASGMAMAAPTSIADEIALPEGFFQGWNHDNGTSTLHFPDTDETINFVPRAAEKPGLSKRSEGASCWTTFPKLSVSGTDQGIAAWRSLSQNNPQAHKIGYKTAGTVPYFGFNFGGVYVYGCYNSNVPASSFFSYEFIQYATYNTDKQCGAYVPGYWITSNNYLFGKCASGTHICLGNPDNGF